MLNLAIYELSLSVQYMLQMVAVTRWQITWGQSDISRRASKAVLESLRSCRVQMHAERGTCSKRVPVVAEASLVLRIVGNLAETDLVFKSLKEHDLSATAVNEFLQPNYHQQAFAVQKTAVEAPPVGQRRTEV